MKGKPTFLEKLVLGMEKTRDSPRTLYHPRFSVSELPVVANESYTTMVSNDLRHLFRTLLKLIQ
ncbi:hypothetical protein WN48_01015 [Eufriesea mexicana]|nr:hypothetical protein WN48_01015 [Eufriesea mexicana]